MATSLGKYYHIIQLIKIRQNINGTNISRKKIIQRILNSLEESDNVVSNLLAKIAMTIVKTNINKAIKQLKNSRRGSIISRRITKTKDIEENFGK